MESVNKGDRLKMIHVGSAICHSLGQGQSTWSHLAMPVCIPGGTFHRIQPTVIVSAEEAEAGG